jgi:hypothetical protein
MASTSRLPVRTLAGRKGTIAYPVSDLTSPLPAFAGQLGGGSFAGQLGFGFQGSGSAGQQFGHGGGFAGQFSGGFAFQGSAFAGQQFGHGGGFAGQFSGGFSFQGGGFAGQQFGHGGGYGLLGGGFSMAGSAYGLPGSGYGLLGGQGSGMAGQLGGFGALGVQGATNFGGGSFGALGSLRIRPVPNPLGIQGGMYGGALRGTGVGGSGDAAQEPILPNPILLNLIKRLFGPPSDWGVRYDPFTGNPIHPLDMGPPLHPVEVLPQKAPANAAERSPRRPVVIFNPGGPVRDP